MRGRKNLWLGGRAWPRDPPSRRASFRFCAQRVIDAPLGALARFAFEIWITPAVSSRRIKSSVQPRVCSAGSISLARVSASPCDMVHECVRETNKRQSTGWSLPSSANSRRSAEFIPPRGCEAPGRRNKFRAPNGGRMAFLNRPWVRSNRFGKELSFPPIEIKQPRFFLCSKSSNSHFVVTP